MPGHPPRLFGVHAARGVDEVRRGFHEQPVGGGGARPGPPPGQVRREGRLRLGLRSRIGRVVVDGHQIDLPGPAGVVDRHPVAEHEVRRHRHPGGRGPQHVALLGVRGQQLVRGEPPEVEHLRRVGQVLRAPRREDLRPVAVVLPPERRGPRVVEVVQTAVTPPQPAPERLGGQVAVAGGAVLVVHVPHRQRRVAAVVLAQRGGHGPGGGAVGRRTGAVRVAAAVAQAHTVGVHRQRFRVGQAEPRRRRGGRRGQDRADAVGGEPVQDPVEPAEVVPARGRLHLGPGEDPDGRGGDAGPAHEDGVLGVDLRRPLLGVVVPAVQQPWHPAPRACRLLGFPPN